MVASLVPDARYPETTAPPPGRIDPPAPQLSVGTSTVDVPGFGPVDVCGMILPVYWDVASILMAKELDAFRPEVVVMNGVAGPRQPMWLELGSMNRAARNDDGSNHLRPAIAPGEAYAPIVDRADLAQPNLMTWGKVQAAAEQTLLRLAHERAEGAELGEILQGVRLAGFPRTSNTYLCNNVTYATGHLMSHPAKRVTLLRASTKARGVPNQVDVTMAADHRATPRMFVHWPSALSRGHHAHAAEILEAIVGAQLSARRDGQLPTPGDNAQAAPGLVGGSFF